LVFVIFYTALSGILTSILGFFLEIGSGIAGRAGGMLPFEIAERGRLALVAVEFLGILVFFFGLTGLVCAYGLWSGQQWGKRLTIRWYFVYGVFALIGLIVSIATGAGVVSSIVSVGVCVGILGFLFGSAELSRHVGRFLESGKK
jgi:pilus assembly protein TadC